MPIILAFLLSVSVLTIIWRRRQIQNIISQIMLLTGSMRKEFHRLQHEPQMVAREHAKEISVES